MNAEQRAHYLDFLRDCLAADLALYRAKRWLDSERLLLCATDLAEAADHLQQAQKLVAETLDVVVHRRL